MSLTDDGVVGDITREAQKDGKDCFISELNVIGLCLGRKTLSMNFTPAPVDIDTKPKDASARVSTTVFIRSQGYMMVNLVFVMGSFNM